MHIVFSGPFRAMQGIYKRYLTVNLCLILLLLSACADDSQPKEVLQPPFKDTQDIPIDEARKIARQLDNQDININTSGLLDQRVLNDPKKLNFKRLFDEDIRDPEKRFLRLETEVQNLSDKLAEIDPAITKLLTIEQELDDLTQQLRVLISAEQPNMIPTPQNRSEFIEVNLQTPPEKLQGQDLNAIRTASGGAQNPNIIHAIRIADHLDKTRIVFDMSDTKKFPFSLKEGEVLEISLPDPSSLDVDLKTLSKKSSLIKSVILSPAQNKLIFSLNRPVVKTESNLIAKDKRNSYHRFYIDLKK